MKKELQEIIGQATGYAVATTGADGLNVVPVSMARATEDAVWLFDFFMNKTVVNVQDSGVAAFTAWKDLSGIQLKGSASYVTEGEIFEDAVAWVREQNPDRVVRGVIVITPEKAYDISAGADAGSPLELG